MPETAAPDAAHRHRAKIARLPVLGVVVVLLVVGLVAGRADTGRATAVIAPPGMPTAAPATALSSTWFCAGVTGGPGSAAPGRLVITDAGDREVHARITILGAGGTTATPDHVVDVVVGAESRRYVTETLGRHVPWLGAIVDLDGGAVTVEQQLTGKLGAGASPCATAGSSSWYFANGATLVNASSEITLLNPYPTPAIANLSFTTNEGQETPSQFSGILVPAGKLVAVDLGSHLRRRTSIATTVTTSDGRVVAWKTDIVSPPKKGTPILGTKAARAADADPASPVLGVTDILGAPAAMTSWRWPEGSTVDGVGEQYAIYNPGARTAQLSLAVDLQGTSATAEPFTLSLGPEQTTTITTGQEARIPSGSGYSVALRSTNGVPVVAERTVAQTAPQTALGIGEMLGATSAAPAWVVGAGAVAKHSDEIVTVSNPAVASAKGSSSGSVTVTLRELAGGHLLPVPDRKLVGRSTIGSITVAAGGRVSIDLAAVGSLDDGLLVDATGPVIVERDILGRRGTHGIGISLAVPLDPAGT